MNTDRALSEWLRGLRSGSLSRREFTRALLGLGLGLVPPLIAELPRPVRPADAQPRRTGFTPSRRGGGGDLKLLWWQAPTILNPHLAIGVKDGDGSRIFYEPLGSFDPDGNSVPVLAAELPTLQNGGVPRGRPPVAREPEKGRPWDGGEPFTADGGVFTWEDAADPATPAGSSGA